MNVDVTLIYDEFHGDTSRTFCIGKVDKSTALLVQRTQRALEIGINAIKNGVGWVILVKQLRITLNLLAIVS